MSAALVEHVSDAWGPFTVRWMVEPPPVGSDYRVTRDEWNEDLSIRTIWEWSL